ncbi:MULTISPECIES: sulfatase-like hydrolase/transferase [unclassified Microbacterium]|uniref:sulfatase-like hydrolase/transferase n=1 Tax=unclassified Microbacterium TaxID=2609290 RepID=UPI0012F8C56C|nr:sulfatase-like hydrolase/transferase [Microbacterium sp. MAH-37]MVQ43678.1 sulfatase-like hydrolase/transferase [Microbacterium sp. MAH-37]
MTRPNVVVIYADDLGYGDIGCFGSEDIRTPHLDRLAARGVRMTDWYSNSPVCSPSRASLLTGRHPVHAGVQEILGGKRGTPGLPEQPTLASRLRDVGYRTGIFGKWHLGTGSGYRPMDRGFEHHFGFLAGCVDYYSHIFYWGQGLNPVHDLWDDGREVYDNGRYLTEVIAEKAASFISSAEGEPFFCYVPFNAPHYPMHAPAEYVDRFPDLPDDRRIMAAMISAMDDGVGRILDALDSAGVTDDTIVFFSSDNGPSTESRNWLNGEEISYEGGSTGGLRGNKGSLFEGGIRVPAIFSWPAGLPQGVSFSEPSAMMDVLPTVLEAAGLPAAAGVDGQSVLESLRGADAAERTLFWEYGPQLAARRGRFKLTLAAREHLGGPFDPASSILVDLGADPAETTDVSAQHPEMVASLRAELMAWAESFDWDPTPWLPAA